MALEEVSEVGEKWTWRDEVRGFYEEYDVLIIIGLAVIVLLMVCCVSCYCWTRCKRREIARLKERFREI